MTFDDFQATVRARFPGMDFEFSRNGGTFRATHERCKIKHFGFSTYPADDRWRFGLGDNLLAHPDHGPTLDAAIDAHQLRLQLINTHALAMGLL
jgi:hypothetical protein